MAVLLETGASMQRALLEIIVNEIVYNRHMSYIYTVCMYDCMIYNNIQHVSYMHIYMSGHKRVRTGGRNL